MKLTRDELVCDCAGARVMIVEDMAMVAAEIRVALERAGCEVVGPYWSRDDALAALEADPHPRLDAAFLDINLAGEECYDIARVLEERHIPFAFLTGYMREFLPKQYGSFPMLEKPFTRADLNAILRQLLQNAHHSN